jgi:hypothetical protein
VVSCFHIGVAVLAIALSPLLVLELQELVIELHQKAGYQAYQLCHVDYHEEELLKLWLNSPQLSGFLTASGNCPFNFGCSFKGDVRHQ